MKKLFLTALALISFVIAYQITWQAAGPATALPSATPLKVPGVNKTQFTRADHSPSAALTTTPVNLSVSHELEGEHKKSNQPAAHFLSSVTAAEAALFLRQLAEQERAQPGIVAAQVSPEGVTLSPGALATYTDALFPVTQARQFIQGYALPESLEAALRKALTNELNAQAAGEALAQRWAQEPSPELRAAMESVGNPWFLAATASFGQQNGDTQMVQEALARLETTPGTATAAALMDMARQQTATFDDIADTLHHWAARHSSTPGVVDGLMDMLASTSDVDLQALLSVGLAGSGDRPRAEAVLSKLAQHTAPSQLPRIRYAQQLLQTR